MSKRGMSQVVSTILLILLILVAIGGIWMVLNAFVFSETSKINLAKFSTNVQIERVFINGSTGIAEIKVARDVGGENITAIKFIVKDPKNSDVFEVEVSDFVELSSRTFTLNFSESDVLNLSEVYEISIAPVYLSPSSGEAEVGRVTDSVGELSGTYCSVPADCGTDRWVNNSEICSQDSSQVFQYKVVYSCSLGFCSATTDQYVKQTCEEGDYCYEGECVTEPILCTNLTVSSDCGISGYVGTKRCATGVAEVVQSYREYSCIANLCQDSTTEQTIEVCSQGQECFNGECFTPVECTKHEDCDFGEICESGFCVTEYTLNNGTIRSAWPFGIGEYFDSFDLPHDNSSTLQAQGKYIIFPGSLETRCLSVKEFTKPDFVGGISYIRLNESNSTIDDGDRYEIWETNYGCSLI
jgi:hypothetical protein